MGSGPRYGSCSVLQDAARIFVVHVLDPRALSARVLGFVQARSWYQELTPIVVTSPPN